MIGLGWLALVTLLAPQPLIPSISGCAIVDAYTTDAAAYAALLRVKRDANATDPNLVLELELEPNPYHEVFASAGVLVMMHAVPAGLYLYVAVWALTVLRKRSRYKIPTPTAVRFVLRLNAAQMIVLAPILATEGFFTSGNLPDEWANPFRSLFLGCGAASSTLIAQVWRDVVSIGGAGQARAQGCWRWLPGRLEVAWALIIIDVVSNLLLARTRILSSSSIVVFQIVPMCLLLIEAANVSLFVWRGLALLRAIESAVSDISGGSLNKFKRKTSRILLLSAFCSACMLVGLVLVGLRKVYYSSPSGAITVGALYVYAKAGMAACHVAICTPPTQRYTAASKRATRKSRP